MTINKPISLLGNLLMLGAICGVSIAYSQDKPNTALKPIPGPGSTLALNPIRALPDVTPLPYGLPLMARFDLLPLLRDTRCFQELQL